MTGNLSITGRGVNLLRGSMYKSLASLSSGALVIPAGF